MRTADHRTALASGALAGAAVVGVGGFAHLTAGGHVAAASFATATVVAAVAGAMVGLRVRWTFWRALGIALTAQPVLHAVLGGGGGHAHHDSSMHAASGSMTADAAAMSSHASSPSASMWLAHVGVALAVAVLARWGARWVRTMPELVRAVADAARRLTVIMPAPSLTLVVAPGFARGRREALAWDSRGPPR